MAEQIATDTVIDGRFALHGKLGAGGAGEVFEAVNLKTGRSVAVKMLLNVRLDSPVAVARFRSEQAVLEQLAHPHIVSLVASGVWEERGYFVMDRALESVRDRLRAGRRYGRGEALRLVFEALSGLAAVHAAGVIHRDIKPGNLLLDLDGHVRICDFGIARAVDADEAGLTRTGEGMGTAGFTAPEQQFGAKHVDARADVYGMGATLYSMVTGRAPPGLVGACKEGAWDRAPHELRWLIQKATSTRPEDRFADATEMARAVAVTYDEVMQPPEPNLQVWMDRLERQLSGVEEDSVRTATHAAVPVRADARRAVAIAVTTGVVVGALAGLLLAAFS